MSKQTTKELDALGKISLGAKLSFDNAEQLFLEAAILRKKGAMSRAYYLHQISLEECAKVDILAAWAFVSLDGQKIDFKKIKSAISNHRRKNKTNAHFLEKSEEETKAETIQKSIKAFERKQEEFHEKSNSTKNSALYVDFSNDKFTSPADVITKEMTQVISDLNENFLSRAFHASQLLERLVRFPEKYAASFKDLKSRLEGLKTNKAQTHPRDIEDFLNSWLNEQISKNKTRNHDLPE